MKPYNEVYDEYQKFKELHPDDPTPLPEFAKQMDAVQGVSDRSEAYDAGVFKRANAAVDRAFDWSPAPDIIASPAATGAGIGRAVGSGFDSLAGTHIAPTLEGVGRETPRMVTEGLLTAVQPEAGAPMVMSRLATLGKVLGYGSAFTRGTAEANGNPLGGAISAASLGAGNVLIPKAGEAAERGLTSLLERGTADYVPGQVLDAAPSAVQSGLGGVANASAGIATATGINEATRQAQLTVAPDASRTPGDRNPFTQENIAGNVAGSAFFLPQLVGSLMHGGPRVSPKQVEQMTARTQVEPTVPTSFGEAPASTSPEVTPTQSQVELGLDKTTLPPDQTPVVSRQDALLNILEDSIVNRKKAVEDGLTDDVDRLDNTIEDTYNRVVKGDMSGVDEATKERLKSAVSDVVKFQPPDTPEKFADLAKMIKSNLDFLNEGRVAYEQELAQREAALNPNDKKAVSEFNKWKFEQATRAEATDKQTWHPQARASQVLDRLWKSGDLPPLSEDWMKSEWGTTFDASGNPTLSNQVLAQKMTNYYADRLDAATKAEALKRKADVKQEEYTGSKVDAREKEFISALHTLPKEVLRDVLNRTVEIRNPSRFDRNERIDSRSGQPVSGMKEWQAAVVRASQSYDPESGTILLKSAGKTGEGPQYKRVPVSRLVEKSEGGGYVWNPSERRVSVSEGGKPAVRTEGGTQVAEGNIEALKRPSGDQIDVADEEAFKRALAEQSDMPFGKMTDLALDESNTLQNPVVDVPEDVVGETAIGDRMTQKQETLRKNLKSLSDDQLWALAEPHFKTRTADQKATKKAQLRLALTAALENMKTGKGGVTEAGKQFLEQQRKSGSTSTKGKGEAEDVKMFLRTFFQSKDTLPAVVGKLLDDKSVARAKTGGPSVKMQVDVTGAPVTEDPGTFANPPQEGKFTEDVARTFRTRIDTLLGREGYSGTTKQFYTELAVALAQQNALPDLGFYRVGGKQLGLAGMDREGRPSLGVNMEEKVGKGREAAMTLQLVQTLAHEIGHLDGYIRDGLIKKPDAYSAERERLLKNFDKFGEALTPDERAAMLTVVQEYVPEQLRNNIKQPDGRPYGTDNPDEFAQQMRGHALSILAHDTPAGRAAAKEMLDYAPVEVRELYRDTFRTVRDIMQVMRDATKDYASRVDSGEQNVMTPNVDPFVVTRGFETILDNARNMTSLRYADKAMADARSWVTNFDKAPQLGMTNSVWFTKDSLPTQMKAQESMPDRPTETAADAVKVAQEYLGPRAFDKLQKPGLVGQFLVPFRQEMWGLERNGNKMARPIADSIFQLEAGSHRILSGLLADFMKRGADGSVQFDATNPLIDRISRERTGPWRDTVNKISKWQQGKHTLADGKTVLDAQSLFVQNEKGELVANPQVKGAQEFWDKTRAGLSKEDQQFVASQSFVLDRLGQRARETLTASIAESNVNRATTLVMATNKGMDFDTANRIAKAAHDAFLSGNVMSLQGTIPPAQIQMLQRLFTGPDGKSGLLSNYMDVVKHFENRPGYRSESLPHDWIVRYRNAAGETKFDSRPTEGQAQALGKSLQARGNVLDGEIVNKADIRKFSPTDDPDGILTKVSERENFVWNKFVEEMGQQHGSAFANDLSAGYTPLETSMRDVSAQGVGKFLKERKDFVDRDSFDYIDSSLAYAQRLSYATAVRSMKQRVELLLNDPSVRLQTSFQNIVRSHVTEMLRPQNETMKQMKGIVSGLMIGGNLSSAVVNGMQSLQTLVPVLDLMNGSKGNFVTPWKQLGKAIADTVDFSLGHKWKENAATTKGIDPAKWSEDQTVAELWRRHVEAGGFTHTVADEIAFGADQKALMNQKFGRGDYGPVTKTSLATSGAYIANQYAMVPFRTVERMNSKVAFLAGARQAYEQGLRGDAAYAKAAQVQGLATFGGGRANASGLQTALSKGFTPGGAGLAMALQQYGLGVLGIHGQFVKDSLGRSKGLSAGEVWHARRAYGTYLMTQTALAGVLGMPLVGAGLTALEKVFGIPANQAVRQGLASLGSDDESGATIAEVGLNGFADYWTGLDVSSRLGTSSLLGTSSYRGFNLEDLAGPIGSILQNGVKSLGYFADGQPLKAATALAPNAVKKALEMTDSKAKYGDAGFRDNAGNLLYMPTDHEATAYAFGFRPRVLARRQQMQSALQNADDLTSQSRDREFDLAAQDTLRGDQTRAQRLALEASDGDPINGSQEALRSIMARAVGATTEKDLLASGSKYNADERSRIYKSFGPDVQHRRSEMDMQDLRMQLATAMGDPRVAPTAGSYKQAAVIDMLVANGSMPRSEAVRVVQLLGL